MEHKGESLIAQYESGIMSFNKLEVELLSRFLSLLAYHFVKTLFMVEHRGSYPEHIEDLKAISIITR